MKKFLFPTCAILAYLFLFQKAHAQSVWVPAVTKTLHGNQVNTTVSDGGTQFAQWDTMFQSYGQWHYDVDNEPNLFSMGGFSMWYGARDEFGAPKVSTPTHFYEKYVFKGPMSELGSASGNYWFTSIFPITKDEINYHVSNYMTPGYQPPANIASWPAHGDQSAGENLYIAPFVDVDNNGLYQPENGDYPCIKGDQAVFIINNDISHYDGCGVNNNNHGIGIEMQTMIYHYNTPELERTTFIDTKVINKSGRDYTDFRAGAFWSPVIGNGSNDRTATDINRKMVFNYNGTPSDLDTSNNNPGFGTTPPATGVVSLNRPVDRSRIFDGYANYPYALPSFPPESMSLLEGNFLDGSPNPNQYAFAGDPSTGTGSLDSTYGWRYQLMTFDVGNLNHLDTALFHIAIVQARGDSHIHSIEKLYNSVDEVQNFYDNLSEGCEQPVLSTDDLQLLNEDVIISPNPANDFFTIQIPENWSVSTITLSDASGRIVQTIQVTDSTVKIDISEEQPGAYFCTFSANNERLKTSKILIH